MTLRKPKKEEVAKTTACTDCNGCGLQDADHLCPSCAGKGKVDAA